MPFDSNRASCALNIFERCLKHGKGEFAGKPFLLMDWRVEIISEIFGTLNELGHRQYQKACGRSWNGAQSPAGNRCCLPSAQQACRMNPRCAGVCTNMRDRSGKGSFRTHISTAGFSERYLPMSGPTSARGRKRIRACNRSTGHRKLFLAF